MCADLSLFCISQSASQFGQLPVAVREHMTLVTGPADIHELTKEILDFCGALPIYKTENSLSPIREENGVLTLSKSWRIATFTRLYAD